MVSAVRRVAGSSSDYCDGLVRPIEFDWATNWDIMVSQKIPPTQARSPIPQRAVFLKATIIRPSNRATEFVDLAGDA